MHERARGCLYGHTSLERWAVSRCIWLSICILLQIGTRLSLLHYMVGTGQYNAGEWDRAADSLSQAIKYNNKVCGHIAGVM